MTITTLGVSGNGDNGGMTVEELCDTLPAGLAPADLDRRCEQLVADKLCGMAMAMAVARLYTDRVRAKSAPAKAVPRKTTCAHLVPCDAPAATIAELLQDAKWRKFSTGASGWNVSGKCVDAFGRTVQIGINLVVVGSGDCAGPNNLADALDGGFVTERDALKAGYTTDDIATARGE